MNNKKDVRIEKDSLGEKEVPATAYYGVQTQRAVENFPVSGLRAHPALIFAYAAVKKACALANEELKALPQEKARPIIQAADEVLSGKWKEQFVIDVYQAGAGTSFNMNTNEVIANRAAEILEKPLGKYDFIHPNDHVNMAQSTNDTFPTASYVAVFSETKKLLSILGSLEEAFIGKGKEFKDIVKTARTHLQDAVPITLGQEFKAYGEALKACRLELERRVQLLSRVALGGTAAGTGANTLPQFREKAISHLAKITNLPLLPAKDPRMALQSHQPLAAVSSALKELALELIRTANDLRLLCSGPTTGFAEIVLPAVQPGSSIMPGKVNPSILECLNMVCFQVVGRDAAVSLCAQAGQMDLNVMTPLSTYNLLDSLGLLINFLPVVEQKCIVGIVADKEKCSHYFEQNPSLATLLNPKIGYARASEVFKEAVAKKTTIPKIVIARKLLEEKELSEILDPKKAVGILD
jgi:aspartate ammonia-lyase